jgi:calcium-dependent protein kinase
MVESNSLRVKVGDLVIENSGNIKDYYKISSCIGRGAFGEVRKCLHKDTRALRAVKIINKKYLEEAEKEKLLSEINILKQMDHPNILKLYEFF